MSTSIQSTHPTSSARLFATAGSLAGPLCLISLVTVVIGASTSGDNASFLASPTAVASSICFLGAMLALASAVVASVLRTASASRTMVPALLALIGSVIVAGGAWANLFVLPGLAIADPHVLEQGIPSIQLGYVISFFLVAAGWATLAITQLARHTVPRWVAVIGLAGSLLALVPAPDAARMLVLTIAASIAAMRQLVTEVAPASRRTSTLA